MYGEGVGLNPASDMVKIMNNSVRTRRDKPNELLIRLEPGDYYSFRNAPITKYSEPDTGRYAALRILSVDKTIVFIVLDGVWSYIPRFDDVLERPMLRNKRFLFGGNLALHYVPVDWEVDLKEFNHLGNSPVTQDDLSIIPKLRGYGSWSVASSDAEGEWRWRHDRDRLLLEVERAEADREAKQIEAQQRYKSRLTHLTWGKLRNEQIFAQWKQSPPFPPMEFAEAARAMVQQTIDALELLGTKPRKKDVRAVLRACVEWFNVENSLFGEVIETEEGEDICEVIGELAFLAGHYSLKSEIDSWRNW